MELQLEVAPDVDPARTNEIADGLSRDVSTIFAYPVRSYPKRVFCIGWQRTGTTSLAEALRMLGLFSWHFAPWIIGHGHFRCDPTAKVCDFDAIAEYTAIADMPIPLLYEELDRAFPGSLFILTTRRTEEWLASALAMAEGLISKDRCLHSVNRLAYGVDEVNVDKFRSRFVEHFAQVSSYFAGRSDFLAIDVTRGDSWPALCEFLHLPEPKVPFPHLNRSAVESALETK